MGDDEGGSLISLDGVALSHTVGASASVIFPCTLKPRRWQAKIQLLGITLLASPHVYAKRRWGHPARMKHNPVLRQRVVFMMTWGLVNCRKAGDFGTVPGMLTHWQEEQTCELIKTLADKDNVACIQETRSRGSGCRFFGAKGKICKLFRMGGKERSDGVEIFVTEKWVEMENSMWRESTGEPLLTESELFLLQTC